MRGLVAGGCICPTIGGYQFPVSGVATKSAERHLIPMYLSMDLRQRRDKDFVIDGDSNLGMFISKSISPTTPEDGLPVLSPGLVLLPPRKRSE